jgi:hypothetical protein
LPAPTIWPRRYAGRVMEPEQMPCLALGQSKPTVHREPGESMRCIVNVELHGVHSRPRSYCETEHLRVLIANERKDRLALVASIVTALRHEVIARGIEVD